MTNDEEPVPQEPQEPQGTAPADDESDKGSIFEGLTPIQERGILALVSEPTIVRAATAIGVNERTIRRWLEDLRFKKVYHTVRREAFDQAIGLTQRYAPVAVNMLAKLMNDPQTPTAAKITAAMGLLRFGRDGIELDDLAQRVEALEGAVEQENGRK